MFTDEFPSTPPSPLPGSGLAAMLSARSITTTRRGHRVWGVVHGLSLPDLLEAVPGRPGARWLLDDLSDIDQATARKRAARNVPFWMTRINGPIERRDAEAMHAAIARGEHRGDEMLDVEIRADVHLAPRGSSAYYATTRDDLPVRMAAGLLRSHVAQCLGRDAATIPLPEPDVAARILASGGMSLRPLETQAFPGFLDIGVSDVEQEAGPAVRSMIFDRIAGTWHPDG